MRVISGIVGLVIFISLVFAFSTKKQAPPPSTPEPMFAHLLPAENVDSAMVRRIDKYFQKRYKQRRFNGTVLFADKGKIVYKGAFGYGTLRNKDTLSTKSPFQLASVTKPITSTAVLMLAEQELLNLEDSVHQHIPDFPYKNVTIKQLLIQKSGLPEYLYFSDQYWPNNRNTINNDDVLCMMKIHEPNPYYRPDYRYNYTNTNYSILASIIEKVSGQTYQDFIEHKVFKPLGMNDSFVYAKDETPVYHHMTSGHDKRRRRIADSHFNGVVGDKGIYSSVEDMLRFDQALYTDYLVSQELLEQAFEPAHKRLYDHDNYGMGWRINTQKNGNKIIYHSGWWKGYTSYFIRMPYSGKTIIVLNNSLRGGFLSNNELRKLIE